MGGQALEDGEAGIGIPPAATTSMQNTEFRNLHSVFPLAFGLMLRAKKAFLNLPERARL
jgi:hypothetical protein